MILWRAEGYVFRNSKRDASQMDADADISKVAIGQKAIPFRGCEGGWAMCVAVPNPAFPRAIRHGTLVFHLLTKRGLFRSLSRVPLGALSGGRMGRLRGPI